MNARAPRPTLWKRLLPIGVAALIYGVALLAVFVGWALWMESQRTGYCGTDCGRGYGLAFAFGFGVLGAPIAGLVGAIAEFAAPRTTRWVAHGTAAGFLAFAVMVFHRLMTNPFGLAP